ncbi:MAG: flavodoxin domain-containing protein [Bacteroidales bacterium]|nr:flavodoxin domain-containing protein [Bacteroidales bacterium]MDD3890855.1 flavodoxin domain-containing protein [Bacteroidales bacterium]
MKATIIYSHKAIKTTKAANLIKKSMGLKSLKDVDVDEINVKVMKDNDLLILGSPSWFDGELAGYWDELVPEIEDTDFSNTKIAIFGNGDQKGYPENFGDAVGLLAEIFESSGATIIGKTSAKEYTFESSKALVGEEFTGLILDFENQRDMNGSRVEHWTKGLLEELKK